MREARWRVRPGWLAGTLLALLLAATAGAQVRMGHFPDPRGRVAPEGEDDTFHAGEPFWVTIEVPAGGGDADQELCLVWKSEQGEVLSRSLATAPAGAEVLALTAPDTRRWPGRRFRLEVIPRQGPGLGCGGPAVATARFALAMPATAGPDGPPRPPGPPRDGSPALPPFPWPPPRPTVRDLLDRDLLARPAPPSSFGEVAGRLLAALGECGYHDRSFYGVPGGFALATRLEQIEPDGTPRAEPERWSHAVPAPEVFDLGSFFRALFSAPEGHYRVLVFVAREGSVPLGDAEIDRETADAWAIGGDLELPAELAARPWGADHRVTVLIYQFQITGLHGEPVAHPDGAPPVARQLARTGLVEALRR